MNVQQFVTFASSHISQRKGTTSYFCSMGQKNVHTYRPQTLAGIACLALSYSPCAVALGIIGLCVYPYNSVFCLDVMLSVSRSSSAMFLHCFVTGNLFFALLLTAFFRCVFTPPGFPDPMVWASAPAIVGTEPPTYKMHFVSQLSRTGELRYCAICNVYKPDDTHHCSSCQRCVRRMDHHCPWINNCVGRETEKFFILFLLYIPVCGFHISGTICWYYYSYGFSAVAIAKSLVLTLVGFISLIIAIVLCGFGSFHLWMIRNGQTTLDLMTQSRLHRGKTESKTHFDEIFGEDRRWWVLMLPIAPRRRVEEETV
jgi:hypothetical protein